MTTPGELVVLRLEVAKQKQIIEILRKIASDSTLQANEIKAWMLALLKKIGPQEVEVQTYQDSGERENIDDVFYVEPVADRPGIVLLSAGKLERSVAEPEAKA